MSIGIIAVLEFRLLAFPFHYDVVGCRYGGLCFIFIILCFFFFSKGCMKEQDRVLMCPLFFAISAS
jgi:hypothetical protein